MSYRTLHAGWPITSLQRLTLLLSKEDSPESWLPAKVGFRRPEHRDSIAIDESPRSWEKCTHASGRQFESKNTPSKRKKKEMCDLADRSHSLADHRLPYFKCRWPCHIMAGVEFACPVVVDELLNCLWHNIWNRNGGVEWSQGNTLVFELVLEAWVRKELRICAWPHACGCHRDKVGHHFPGLP